MKKQSILVLMMLITMMSCDKSKETIDPPANERDYSTGLWIINEGAFNANNASIDVRMPNGEMVRDVFQFVNGFPLGDVLQKVLVHEGVGYAVLNNSNKVVVFDAKSFSMIR
jgi:hypothetical protein